MSTSHDPLTTPDLIITHRGTVYPWQCDHMGHMNVMWYNGKFDESSWQLLSTLGLTAERFKSEGFGMAAVEQHIQYKRELQAGDLITVRSGLLEIGNKSLRIIHEMRHDSSGELAACMVAVGVCVDGSTRRSRPLPDDVRMRARLKTHAPAERHATNSVSKITAESEDRPASAASRANRNLVGEILEAMFCPMEIVR
jgi:acyl-CoA thioester hydrolase